MELSVLERLGLLNILPEQGNYMTLKIVRQIREELSFSEADHRVLQFQQDENALRWNDLPAKQVEIGDVAANIIKQRLRELDREGGLHQDWLGLYERFVLEEKA